MEVEQCSIWLEDADAGDFRCLASLGYDDDPLAAPCPLRPAGRAATAPVDGNKTPFTLAADEFSEILGEEQVTAVISPAAIAPLHAGFGIRGWITVRAPRRRLGPFTDERLRLLEGLAYRASVALQKSCCSSPSRRAPT